MNREDFTILKNNNVVYFDNGATTLKPDVVRDSINDYYNKYTSNIHRGDYSNSLKVSELYEECREKVREYINANHSSEIIFTTGTTGSLNDIVFGYFKYKLKAGDEVILTEAEHASNILPWFVLEKELGIVIKYINLDIHNEVTIDNLKKVISNKTKVVSLAHITNVIGDIRDIKMISKVCHENNILLVVDAAQSIGHVKIDVQDMDIDFMAFSSHKMYGPTGIGVLFGKFNLLQDLVPRNYGGDMNAIFTKDGYMELKDLPSRLEAGTPNIEGVIGLSACIDYINKIGIDNICKYEHELRDYLVSKLKYLDYIELYNSDNHSTTVAFNIKGVFSQDTSVYLNHYNIAIRAGNHCTKVLKDDLDIKNTCRVSLYLYNTKEEVDLLINVLKNSKNIWEEIL